MCLDEDESLLNGPEFTQTDRMLGNLSALIWQCEFQR